MSTTKDTPCDRRAYPSRQRAHAAKRTDPKLAHKSPRQCRRHGEVETWHLVIPTPPKDRTRKKA